MLKLVYSIVVILQIFNVKGRSHFPLTNLKVIYSYADFRQEAHQLMVQAKRCAIKIRPETVIFA